MKKFSWQKLLIGLALAAGCMLLGASIPMTNQAHGEVTRGAPEPPAFQAGGVPILKDISATLRQMDGRMARLEAIAQKMQARAAISAQRTASAETTDENGN
jgi:hypothetical protein